MHAGRYLFVHVILGYVVRRLVIIIIIIIIINNKDYVCQPALT